MRIFALFFFVGCAFASQSEWSFESGKEYVYEYSGRMLTGMPQLASHYSGLGLNATVVVNVLSPNKLRLRVERPKFVRISERLQPRNSQDGPDGANWREVFLPEMQEPDQEYQNILREPIEFELFQGEIKKANVAVREPQWSVNLKKSLALLFQTKTDSSSWQSQDNQVSMEGLNFWKTKEEGIDGVCEVTYQINELPKYMIRDRPEMIPYPELCQQQKYFEVTKTKDVNTCEKRSAYSWYKPGRFACQGPNCKDMWARTSQTRYIACGSRPGSLVIQTIINQGELNQNVMGFNTERMVTGTQQILKLREVRTDPTPVPMPRPTVQLKSMMYEYSVEAYGPPSQQSLSQEEQQLDDPSMPRRLIQNPQEVAKTLPRNFLAALSKPIDQEIPKSKIIEETVRNFRKVAHQVSNPIQEQVEDKQITMSMFSLSKAMSILNKSELKSVYHQVKQNLQPNLVDATKNLYFDVVLMTGTPEAIDFLKEQLESGEMSKPQAVSLFMWLPQSLVLPTEEVLESLFNLVKSQRVSECPWTKNVAIMSFSTLIEKSCLSRNRATSYPTWVWGKFCQPDSQILMQQWVPYLMKELEERQDWSKKNEIIVALGMLPHKDIIGKLVPFVEGRNPINPTEPVPQMTRLLSLWSLATAGALEPQTLEPIAYTIFANPSEATEMRIAAFNVLLKINPKMSTFHKIAARTWTEQNPEVLKVVNTAIFTLSKQFVVEPEEQIRMNLPRKAYLTWPLIKKVKGVLPTSAAIYSAESLKRLGVGYQGLTSWVASNSSFIPTEMYTQLEYFFEQLRFNPVQLGLRQQGLENIYRRFAEIITPLKPGQSGEQAKEEMAQKIKSSLNSEWKKVIQQLGIKARENNKMTGAAFLRIVETTPLFASFEDMTTEILREKITPFLKSGSSKIQDLKNKYCDQEVYFRYQKAVELAPFEATIPMDMGLPLNMISRMPVVLGFQGSLKLRCDKQNPGLEMKTNVFYNSQYNVQAGTIIPFTKEYAVTGVDETAVVKIPARFDIKIDVPQQHLRLKVLMYPIQIPSVNLFHFHVHPYTAHQKVDDFSPIVLANNRNNMKLIKSQDKLKSKAFTFGEYLGFHMESKIHTESRYMDMESVVMKLSSFNYNPANMMRFSWGAFALNKESKPSVRRHEYTLSYKPGQTQTKELIMDLKIGYASKSKQSEPLKYHKISIDSTVAEEQVQKEQDPLKKQLKKAFSPFTIKSEEVSQKQMHTERQEKISEVELRDVDSAQAVVLKYTTTLIAKNGKPSGSWSYYATLMGGKRTQTHQRKVEAKWNIQLESQQSGAKVQNKGQIDLPILPLWSSDELRSSLIDFKFFNNFKMTPARSSNPWEINVHGNAKTSHEQKEFSRQSKAYKECVQKIEQQEEQGQSQKVQLGKLSKSCEIAREQASALDEVDFSVKYVNVPRWIHWYEQVTVEKVKAFFWPYLKNPLKSQPLPQQSQQSQQSSAVLVRVLFHRETPSFDLIINRASQEKVAFQQIRLPYPLNIIFPLKASRNNVKAIAQELTGNTLYPVCKVERKTIQTFDNKTMPFQIDYCHHLLAADCSQQKSFAVFTRLMHPDNRKQLKVMLGNYKIIISPDRKPEKRTTVNEMKVELPHQEISLTPGKWIELKENNRKMADIYMSHNKVVHLKAYTAEVDLTFDGENIAIETSQVMKNKLCGICGNLNNQVTDEMEGPQKCVFSKPEIQIASYRVHDMPSQCQSQKPLPSSVSQKLQQEKQQCVKQHQIPTKITKSLETQVGKCNQLKHAVIRRPGQVCFSKKPVIQCSAGCQAVHNQLLKKNVPFTCLTEDRVAEHYVQKATKGQRLQELESHPTEFETQVPQPRSCVPSTNEL